MHLGNSQAIGKFATGRERSTPIVHGRPRTTMSLHPTASDGEGGSLSEAPVDGTKPNNVAELGIDSHDAKLDLATSCHSQLQTQERRALLEEPALTGYLKTFGSVGNSPHSPVLPGRTKGTRLSVDPYTIDHNTDSYSYSRDATRSASGSKDTLSPTLRSQNNCADDFRLSSSSSTKKRLKRVPEEMENNNPASTALEQGRPIDGPHCYGSVHHGALRSRYGGNARASTFIDGTLSYEEEGELSEEEEEWLLDEELAKQGLYRGNYKNLLLLYTLVPVSAGLAFVLLALIPILAFPSSSVSQFPYPPYLPYPLPEVFTATALWSLSYLLRDFLYAISLFATSGLPCPNPQFIPVLTSVLSAILQSASTLFFRQFAVPILLIPYYSTERSRVLRPSFSAEDPLSSLSKDHFPTWQDDAFRRVWWIALGWAAAEAVVGIKQGYESIALYRDVLVNVSKKSSRAVLMFETRGMGRSDQAGIQVDTKSRGRTLSGGQNADEETTVTQRASEADQLASSGTGVTLRATVSQSLHSNSSLSSPSNSRSRPNSRYDRMEDPGETQPLLNPGTNPLTPIQPLDDERILVENEVERDLDQLIALKSRAELEEIYGIPVIRIPSFLSCLHRINSILISLGSCLLLTAAYMRSTIAYSFLHSEASFPPNSFPSQQAHLSYTPSNKTLIITLPILLAVQTILTMMHTPWILPRIGIQTFVYVTLLVSLGLFFGGLGLWEALM